MKKQYIKPQTKEVVVRLLGSVLGNEVGVATDSWATDVVGSRRGNVFDDDEEEPIEESMWK